MPTPAQRLAVARATGHVRDTVAALGLRLEDLVPAQVNTADERPSARGSVTLTWWLPVGTAHRAAFATLARHWLARGFRLIGDGRGDALPYLWAESPADGYRLGLEGNAQDRLLLRVSSPGHQRPGRVGP